MRRRQAGRPRAAIAPWSGVRTLALAAFVALAAFASPPALAQTSVRELIRAEFWADVEPVASVGEPWPVTPELARERILEEAAWVYGGVIWGFEFAYTPYDKARAIAERFELAPIAGLKPELLALVPDALASGVNGYSGFVEYRPGPDLASLMESYSREPWKGCQGIGRADMILGVKGRRAAYEDGLRAAIRSYLQGALPNKPRQVKGRIVLERPPSLAIINGAYTAQLRARAMVLETIPYKMY
jgi:hypothetical protein